MLDGKLFWRLFETSTVALVQTVVFVVMARMLSPSDIGVHAIVMAVIALSSSLAEGGLGSSLIQRDKLLPYDVSSVFYFAFLSGFIFAGVVWLSSGWLASFYQRSEIEGLLSFGSLIIILSVSGGVLRALIIRDLNFKLLAMINVCSSLCGGLIAICMLVFGFGLVSYIASIFVTALASLLIVLCVVYDKVIWSSFHSGALKDP